MNGLHKVEIVRTCSRRYAVYLFLGVIAATMLFNRAATAQGGPKPIIQRVALVGDIGYMLARGTEPNAQIVLRLIPLQERSPAMSVDIPLFATPPAAPSHLVSRATSEAMFVSRVLDLPALKKASLTSFPLDLLLKRIAHPNLRASWDDVPHGTSFHRVDLAPVDNAMYGVLSESARDNEPIAPFPKAEVFFDFYLLSGNSIKLFLTIDGQLSEWRFDGTEWTRLRTYSIRVVGEFAVMNGGTAIVARHNSRWCLFSGIEEGDGKIMPIGGLGAGEFLTVIDVIDSKQSFFILESTLYNAIGTSVEQLSAGRDQIDMVREVADKMRSAIMEKKE